MKRRGGRWSVIGAVGAVLAAAFTTADAADREGGEAKEGEQRQLERRVFSPPAGARCEYDLRIETTFAGKESIEDLAVTAFRPAEAILGVGEAAIWVRPKDDKTVRLGSPILFVGVNDEWLVCRVPRNLTRASRFS